MKRDLYIEILKMYNELANSQLSFYHKYVEYLNKKIAGYEKREKEQFEASIKREIDRLSK